MEEVMVTQSRRRVVDQIRTIARKLRKIAKQSAEQGFPITELIAMSKASSTAYTGNKRICSMCEGDPVAADGSICSECGGEVMVSYTSVDNEGRK